MNVDRHRSVDNVRRSIAIEIPLLDSSVFEGDGSFCGQLRNTKGQTRLKLAFDSQRVHCQTAVKSNCRAVDPGPLVIDGNLDCASDGGAKGFVQGHTNSVTLRYFVTPHFALFIQQIERGTQLLGVSFQELTTISYWIGVSQAR